MTELDKERIAFKVEITKVIEILSSAIYDSPKAFLRENVQNAYDAILMRRTEEDLSITECKIDITVEPNRITVHDDGIGMKKDVLKNNFWKAGASGKNSEFAQRSGVIGTFGIGAMANFGVCTTLCVETRNTQSPTTFISSAIRDKLSTSEECIDIESVTDMRGPGTIITADLDPAKPINETDACEYLRQYVRFLPVPITVNGRLISQESFEDALDGKAKGFEQISSRKISFGEFAGTLHVLVNNQNRILAKLTDIKTNATSTQEEIFLIQGEEKIFGFRNLFGLAQLPISGHYRFGGFVNLSMLKPTAGREALSQESIQHARNLLEMIEVEVSKIISDTHVADKNRQFQQYILSNNLTNLAKKIKIQVLPDENKSIELDSVESYQPNKSKRYYRGKDPVIVRSFSNEQANLFHVSQDNPRRNLQIRYLQQFTKLEETPDEVLVDEIPNSNITFEEKMFLSRLRSILCDDYLIFDVDVAFATISHGVFSQVKERDNKLDVFIARGTPIVLEVIKCYNETPDAFNWFMRGFIREHVYPHIVKYAPSLAKQDHKALYKRFKERREIFRIHENEYGRMELLFSGLLTSNTNNSRVQRVSQTQVGRVEQEIPELTKSNAVTPSPDPLKAAFPILQEDLEIEKKVLTVDADYQKLNNFRMFVAVSDHMMKCHIDFLRRPHTTRLMWGANRIVYVFTDATEKFNLYYDIGLKSPLRIDNVGGIILPTSTIITKNRIFIPIPKDLVPVFQITDEDKEFYVCFDTIP
ncbi:MAG: ATP-binding protein [Hyphomicrobiales bacterium]|nr:ATP-binding protein [Hyphomicrobiales bacterium]